MEHQGTNDIVEHQGADQTMEYQGSDDIMENQGADDIKEHQGARDIMDNQGADGTMEHDHDQDYDAVFRSASSPAVFQPSSSPAAVFQPSSSPAPVDRAASSPAVIPASSSAAAFFRPSSSPGLSSVAAPAELHPGLMLDLMPQLAAITKSAFFALLERPRSMASRESEIMTIARILEALIQAFKTPEQTYISCETVEHTIDELHGPHEAHYIPTIDRANLTKLLLDLARGPRKSNEIGPIDAVFPSRIDHQADPGLDADDVVHPFFLALEIRTQLFIAVLVADVENRDRNVPGHPRIKPRDYLCSVFCRFVPTDPVEPDNLLENGPYKPIAGEDLEETGGDENVEMFRGGLQQRIEEIRPFLKPTPQECIPDLQRRWPATEMLAGNYCQSFLPWAKKKWYSYGGGGLAAEAAERAAAAATWAACLATARAAERADREHEEAHVAALSEGLDFNCYDLSSDDENYVPAEQEQEQEQAQAQAQQPQSQPKRRHSSADSDANDDDDHEEHRPAAAAAAAAAAATTTTTPPREVKKAKIDEEVAGSGGGGAGGAGGVHDDMQLDGNSGGLALDGSSDPAPAPAPALDYFGVPMDPDFDMDAIFRFYNVETNPEEGGSSSK